MGRAALHDPRRRTQLPRLQALRCHPEERAFCATKDLGAPREHSRVLCENAKSRVWRASSTPTTSSPTTAAASAASRACPERATATEWVKCTICHRGNSYKCHLDSNGQPYSAREIDFIAAYVIPTDTWYILPIKATNHQPDILLTPKAKNGKYAKYKEAWHLLRRYRSE